jgi:hypothetical protein
MPERAMPTAADRERKPARMGIGTGSLNLETVASFRVD